MTSDGRCAAPPGMFSAAHRYPVTFTGSARSATAVTAASTAAAPLMSHFIVSMDFGGLSERPPESNVMPLPTNATVRVASGCVYARRTSRGGRTDPWPAAGGPAVAAPPRRRPVDPPHGDARLGRDPLGLGRERGGR